LFNSLVRANLILTSKLFHNMTKYSFVDLALSCPHILLLDEPTNNLDIETIDALIDAMNAFNGGIVVVTHDQRLIEYCDCELWVVEKESVTKWTAGFDDYKESLLREMEERMDKEGQIRKQKLEAAAKEKADKLAQLAAKLRK
jgi:ATP-binding cassette subfamily F protein 1